MQLANIASSSIHTNRRTFLGGGLAALGLGVFGPSRTVAANAPLEGTARVRFGVMSDVHLNRPGDETAYRRALQYFRDHGADGVMIAGDIADTGKIEQLKRCADIWWETFPNGKAPDGRHVEQLFVLGNHDMQGWAWDRAKRNDPAYRALSLGPDQNYVKAWKNLFHEDYNPIWMKTVKGYTFMGAHWGNEKNLDAFLQQNKAKIDPKKPFFYAQHPHPHGTCIGDWAWGNEPHATNALKKWPNAVAFSGHSHYSFTDERTIWQGEFISINTSSMRYSSSDYNIIDNAGGHHWGYNRMPLDKLSPRPNYSDGQQAMLVTVTDDALRIARLEFHFGCESLGDDWIVPLRPTPATTYAFARRAALRSAPVFSPTAEVTVSRIVGAKNRPLVRVDFPAALAVNKSRPFTYEVTPILVEDTVEQPLAAKTILGLGFHLAEHRSHIPNACIFGMDKLPPKAHIRFAVRPIECFGRKGAPIYSKVLFVTD